MVDEIAFAMKSYFIGLKADGFDFIQGLRLGLHLSKAKISSLPCNDFKIKYLEEMVIHICIGTYSHETQETQPKKVLFGGFQKKKCGVTNINQQRQNF